MGMPEYLEPGSEETEEEIVYQPSPDAITVIKTLKRYDGSAKKDQRKRTARGISSCTGLGCNDVEGILEELEENGLVRAIYSSRKARHKTSTRQNGKKRGEGVWKSGKTLLSHYYRY